MTLVKMMDKGTAHFDNALQRGRRAACSSCRLHQCSISQGQGGCCHRNIFLEILAKTLDKH